MAGDEIFDSIRLRKDDVGFTEWPKLSCSETSELAIAANTLQVTGAIKATSFQGDGSTLDGVVKKLGDTITGALTIQNNLSVTGSVGIGSTDPAAAKLHIYAPDNDALKITNTALSKTARMGVDRLGVWIEPSETDSSIRLNANPGLVGLYINGADGKIGMGTNNPEAPVHVVGNLLGAVKGPTGEALRVAVGSTLPGTTNWIQYDAANNGLYVDIDTSSARFSATPYYFTSLGGTGSHWRTEGATSIYAPTASNFRVYVYVPGTTVTQANEWQWHIQWLAIGN